MSQKLFLFPTQEIVMTILNAVNKEYALYEKLLQYASILKDNNFPDICHILKEYLPGDSKWIARAMLRSGAQTPEAAYYMNQAMCFDKEILEISLDVYGKNPRFRAQLQREINPIFARRISESLKNRGMQF